MSTATSLTTSTAAADTGRGLLRVAQTLMIGPLGGLVIFGSIYFGLLAPTDETTGAFDWFVGAWAFAMGVASIVLATRLRSGGDRALRLAIGLAGLHAAYGIVKLTVYAEAEAATFMAVDAVLLAILARLRATRG